MRGLALAVLSALAFGASGPFAKPAMESGISPLQLTSVRICLAAVVLLAVAVIRPRALRFRRSESGLLLGYGLLGVVGSPLFFFISAARIPVGIAMLLEFTAPLLVALWLRLVRGTRLPAAVWWGILVALLGLAMIGQVWEGLRLDLIGVLAGLASAVCTAGYYLLGERGATHHDPLGVLAVGMVIGAVALAVVSPPWLVPFSGTTTIGPVWLLLVTIALVCTVLAYLAGIISMAHLPSSAASVMGLIEPVVATGLAWWLLGEALTPVQVAGAAVLLSGATVVQLASKRPVTPEPLPQ